MVDMMRRTLQQFPITSHTVPVVMSRYPEGVYVVNIKTNMGSDGVKVVKYGNNSKELYSTTYGNLYSITYSTTYKHQTK